MNWKFWKRKKIVGYAHIYQDMVHADVIRVRREIKDLPTIVHLLMNVKIEVKRNEQM